MNSRISIKQGETLSLAGTVTLPAGTWSATSSAVGPDGVAIGLVVTLTAPTVADGPHAILIEKPAADTKTWPLGTLNADIRFVDAGGVVIYSPTFPIFVSDGITA